MDAFDAQRFPRLTYELLVLAALAESRKHGYQIALQIEERSRGMFVLHHGTLYPILHRLERDGLMRGAQAHDAWRDEPRAGLCGSGSVGVAAMLSLWLVLGGDGRAPMLELIGWRGGGRVSGPAESLP